MCNGRVSSNCCNRSDETTHAATSRLSKAKTTKPLASSAKHAFPSIFPPALHTWPSCPALQWTPTRLLALYASMVASEKLRGRMSRMLRQLILHNQRICSWILAQVLAQTPLVNTLQHPGSRPLLACGHQVIAPLCPLWSRCQTRRHGARSDRDWRGTSVRCGQ